MAVTYLEHLIDPDVLGTMIEEELPNSIKFTGIAPIDTTLQGQPGSTITIPKWKYIGDAMDVAEGAAIDYAQLSTTDQKHTIKKAGKGVTLTDEAILSGYGDPQGTAVRQISKSIASKVDNDILAEALTAPLTVPHPINIDMIDAVETAFNDEDEATGVLFVNTSNAIKLRKAAGMNWTRASDLGDNLLVKGAFGEVLGWTVVRSNKLKDHQALFVKSGALTTFMKRGVLAESARDIDHKLTKFNADQHYVVGITDDTKIVIVDSTGV